MGVVLITGCSTGFGKQSAEALALKGHHVFATMRNIDGKNREAAEALRKASTAGGGKIEVLELDVTSGVSVDTAAEQVRSRGLVPDVVVNNAGQMFVGFTEAFTAEELSRQLDINVVGIHRVLRAFLPNMRKRGSGLVINLSSVAGRFAAPFFGVYHASKWAVEGYSLGLRRELACTGVDVVVVEPGPFSTELFPQSPKPEDTDGRAATYPAVAPQTFKEMGTAFEGMFEDPEVPTDPKLVVDRIVELIEMAPGTRPFRTAVGFDVGVTARNASDEAHDPEFLEMMGLTEFVKLRTEVKA
jgi:NAD(P)-dependent dehydrogenase (short-subunit alcohol dehydrogenase family)